MKPNKRCGDEFTNSDAVSLKEYFDTRLQAIEKSTTLARESIELRLEGMNEFRASLRDAAATFITRNEMNTKFDATDKNRKDNIALIIAILGVVISIVGILIKGI